MIKILQGDVIDKLAELPDKSVHCCITSPPYWGLRSYLQTDDPLKANEIGLEKTPEEYIAKMVQVFKGVWRVLRDDGSLWLNLGDSYNGSGEGGGGNRKGNEHGQHDTMKGKRPSLSGLKPKDLCGIPWRVALALQADGWYLRSDIIWAKPNPMPESVTDRPTKSHEYIFLLTKSQRYYYDNEAVKETSDTIFRRREKNNGESAVDTKTRGDNGCCGAETGTRNLRSVWTITTKGYAEAHFATFPPEIPERCIKAGTSEKGVCEKCGAGWVRVVEKGNLIADAGYENTHRVGIKNFSADKTVRGSDMLNRGIQPNQHYENKTTGWQPTCTCYGVDIIPDQPTKPSKPELLPKHENDIVEWYAQWDKLKPIYDKLPVIPATVLDIFGGSGTTGQVAENLGRDCILIELNPKYIPLIQKRTHHTNMFAS